MDTHIYQSLVYLFGQFNRKRFIYFFTIIVFLSFSCKKDQKPQIFYVYDNDSISSDYQNTDGDKTQDTNQIISDHTSTTSTHAYIPVIEDDSEYLDDNFLDYQDETIQNDDDNPAHQITRFLVFGDGGTGGEKQYKTAQAMKIVCDTLGCDFALYLGDVIYNTGVLSSEDSQFQTKFEQPYAELNFPFYITVGNHDALGNLSAMVEYSTKSDKFKLPSLFYEFQIHNIYFYALNTNSLDDNQADMLKNADQIISDNWKIVFGHHPYKSNGLHGNAAWSRKDFYEQHLCNRVDIFFAGHDHDKQHLKPECGIRMFISGAAGGIREVETKDNTLFAKSSYGFGWVQIDDNTLNFKFFDENAVEEYDYVEMK